MEDDKSVPLEPKDPLECYKEGVRSYKRIKLQLKNLELIEYTLDPDTWITVNNDITNTRVLALKYFNKAINESPPELTVEVNVGKNPMGETLKMGIPVTTKAKEKRGRLCRLFNQNVQAISDLTFTIESPNDSKNKQKNLTLRGLAYFDLKQYRMAVYDFFDGDVRQLDELHLSRLQEKKEALYTAIRHIKAENVRTNILFQALFPDTFWGKIFYFSRGYYACSLGRGYLKKILKDLETIPTLKNHIQKERYLQALWLLLLLSPNSALYEQILEESTALTSELELIHTAKKESLLAQIAKLSDEYLRVNVLFHSLFPGTPLNDMLINSYDCDHQYMLKNKIFTNILTELAKIKLFKTYIFKTPTSVELVEKLKSDTKHALYIRLASQAPMEILNALDIPKSNAAAITEAAVITEEEPNNSCLMM